jgi:hypothetical protein
MSKYFANPLPAFKKFRHAVRVRVLDASGFDLDELEDYPLWDAFVDGFSIEETAEDILLENGLDPVHPVAVATA